MSFECGKAIQFIMPVTNHSLLIRLARIIPPSSIETELSVMITRPNFSPLQLGKKYTIS